PLRRSVSSLRQIHDVLTLIELGQRIDIAQSLADCPLALLSPRINPVVVPAHSPRIALFADRTPLSITGSIPAASASAMSADMSFGMHRPPYPGLPRNTAVCDRPTLLSSSQSSRKSCQSTP